MEQKTAFITEATAGIGKETAILLAQNIVVGRRKDRLELPEKELMPTIIHDIIYRNK